MLYNKDQKKTFKKVVKKLKEIEIDGENTQQLLQEIGHEEQMLRQLVMSMPIDVVVALFKERVEYERDCGNNIISPIDSNIEHRLMMIKDDAIALRQFININDLTKIFDTDGDLGFTCLNNIEIACDLTSDESLSWKLYSDNKTIGEKLNEFLQKLDDNEQFFEFNKLNGNCEILCSGSTTRIQCTPFLNDDKYITIVQFENNTIKSSFKIAYNEPIDDDELEVFKKFYTELVYLFIKTLT
jgi:hypothetical protein